MKITSLSFNEVSLPHKNSYSKGSFEISSTDNKNDVDLSEEVQILSSNAPKAVDQQANSINFRPGETKNIGTVDGYPLNLRLNSNGVWASSFQIPIHQTQGSATPEQEFAAEVFYSHSSDQQNRASSIMGGFQELYQVANGSMSVNQYNETNKEKNISVSGLLTSLGINISKSFSFNGKTFSLDSQGNLHALLPSNPLR